MYPYLSTTIIIGNSTLSSEELVSIHQGLAKMALKWSRKAGIGQHSMAKSAVELILSEAKIVG